MGEKVTTAEIGTEAEMRFKVETSGKNSLNLRQMCEEHVNSLWIPDHLTVDQKVEFAFDYFKRAIESELKLLTVSNAG